MSNSTRRVRAAIASAIPAAVAGSVAGVGWAARSRSSQFFGPSDWRGAPGRQALALTFDDGPSAATLDLLKVLADYGVRATFFVCGVNLARAPEITAAVSGGGHQIGNHSYSHPNFALSSPQFVHEEFARTQETIARVTGVPPALLRAPYGVRWFGFPQMQRRLGLHGVMWTVIGRDWRLPAPAISRRVISCLEDGAIVCLHDGRATLKNPDARATVEAVRRIIPAALEKGYHFETVSQVLCPMTN